jgi:hypothetical protein
VRRGISSQILQFAERLISNLFHDHKSLRKLLETIILSLVLLIIIGGVAYLADPKLIDPQLIASIVLAEVPMGFLFNFMLSERSDSTLASIARINAALRFQHLLIHYANTPEEYAYPELAYFVLNRKTKRAYYVPREILDLRKARVVKAYRRHRSEEALMRYFAENEIKLEERYPTLGELSLRLVTPEEEVVT